MIQDTDNPSKSDLPEGCTILTAVTLGDPTVMVPVLSKQILFRLFMSSRGSPPLMRMPCRAPTPVPTCEKDLGLFPNYGLTQLPGIFEKIGKMGVKRYGQNW